MLRWLVTGSRGQLGCALVANLSDEDRAGWVTAAAHSDLEVADAAAVQAFFGALSVPPDVVVNAAAYTHVDRCEREPDAAQAANAVAPGILAAACSSVGAQLVHVSTDYVFPGDGERPYREDDPTGPRSVYGKTKLAGEAAVRRACPGALVVRTSWIYGEGRNFPAAILNQAALRRRGSESGPLRVVDDQRGRPTWAVDLAAAIRQLVEAGASGLYHVANDGVASWWDFARACLDEAGCAELEIERIRTGDLDLPAPRPAYSVLDCSRAEDLGVKLRPWREALRAYLSSDGAPRVPPEEVQ